MAEPAPRMPHTFRGLEYYITLQVVQSAVKGVGPCPSINVRGLYTNLLHSGKMSTYLCSPYVVALH